MVTFEDVQLSGVPDQAVSEAQNGTVLFQGFSTK